LKRVQALAKTFSGIIVAGWEREKVIIVRDQMCRAPLNCEFEKRLIVGVSVKSKLNFDSTQVLAQISQPSNDALYIRWGN